MMAPTHTAFALAGALAVLNVTHPEVDDGVVLVGVTMVTAMLPDKLEGGILPHRGATHRWWMGALLVAVVAYGLSLATPVSSYAPWVAGGLAVGYGMHLFADGLTRSGLPKRKRRGQARAQRLHLLPRSLRPHTGKLSEVPFRLAAVIACAVLAWSLLPSTTRDAVHRGLAGQQPAHRAR